MPIINLLTNPLVSFPNKHLFFIIFEINQINLLSHSMYIFQFPRRKIFYCVIFFWKWNNQIANHCAKTRDKTSICQHAHFKLINTKRIFPSDPKRPIHILKATDWRIYFGFWVQITNKLSSKYWKKIILFKILRILVIHYYYFIICYFS